MLRGIRAACCGPAMMRALNPKPKTQSPKPKTQNPKPQILFWSGFQLAQPRSP